MSDEQTPSYMQDPDWNWTRQAKAAPRGIREGKKKEKDETLGAPARTTGANPSGDTCETSQCLILSLSLNSPSRFPIARQFSDTEPYPELKCFPPKEASPRPAEASSPFVNLPSPKFLPGRLSTRQGRPNRPVLALLVVSAARAWPLLRPL